MASIALDAGFSEDARKSLTNVSSRKHLVTTCRRAGVPDGTTVKVHTFVY